MSEFDDARSAALKQVAQFIASKLGDVSPSEKIRSGWQVLKRKDRYLLRNRHVSAVATNADWHHYVFGHDPTIATNAKRPERTNWASDAVLASIDEGQQRFRGEYLNHVSTTSPYFKAR